MLPAVRTDQEWQAVVWDEQLVRPAAEDLAARVLEYLHGRLPVAPPAPGRPPVLLHTEVTRENLIVSPGTWTLSGLLDFETAMTGERPYEFAAVGLVLAHGDRRLLGRLLVAYGHRLDPRELLAHTLLHPHTNLPESLSDLPRPPEPTLESLASTWFGTA
jgi:hygromycin-B 7''-O-kinase